jgi:8-oxo-dGTP diphosphatase
VLLLQRVRPPEPGSWALPGGKVDWGETPAQALAREVAEELGITDVVVGALITITSVVDPLLGDHWVSPIYAIERWTGTPHITEPHKHRGLDWFALGALPAPLMLASAHGLADVRS